MELNVILYAIGEWLLGIAVLIVSIAILIHLED